MATGAGMQQTGQAGEHDVAAELIRREANAVTFSGNIPIFHIIAITKSKQESFIYRKGQREPRGYGIQKPITGSRAGSLKIKLGSGY